MLYLNIFFKSMLRSSWRGALFLFLTLLLMTSLHSWNAIRKYTHSFSPEMTYSPYFSVLITGSTNVDILMRKIKDLNGVEQVLKKQDSEMKKAVEEGLAQAGVLSELPDDLKQENYTGLKIILNPNFNTRNVLLIKEYIKQVVGLDKLAFGRLVRPDKLQQASASWQKKMFYRFGDIIMIVLIMLLWFLMGNLMTKEIQVQSYLVEKFQRRHRVAAKSIAHGLSILLVGISLVLWALDLFHLYAFGAVVAIFSLFVFLHLKQWSWRK